jgi:hypothetical protein
LGLFLLARRFVALDPVNDAVNSVAAQAARRELRKKSPAILSGAQYALVQGSPSGLDSP